MLLVGEDQFNTAEECFVHCLINQIMLEDLHDMFAGLMLFLEVFDILMCALSSCLYWKRTSLCPKNST